MTDVRGSVFADDRPRSRGPTQAPEAPVSIGDVIGARWTLGRQDAINAPLAAEQDAYRPVIDALQNNRSAFENLLHPSAYQGDDFEGIHPTGLNRQKVWDDVAARRRTDPDFLKDVPATSPAEFSAWVHAQEAQRRKQAQDIVERQRGIIQGGVGFATDIGTGLVDPINLTAMILTAGTGGAGLSLARGMAREALVNGAIEAAELPSTSSNRAGFGEDMTAGDMIGDVGMAALGGAAFHGGAAALKAGGRAAAKAIGESGVGQAAGRTFAPFALRGAKLDAASDLDVSRAFSDAIPAEYRTPEQSAALHVLDRDEQIDTANPFAPTPAGHQAHADRMGAALAEAMAVPGGPSTIAQSAPRAPSITAPDLSPDRVIGFVMRDLEGGAKVVRYGDGDGGTTKYGIAAKFNPGVDVANLTQADAARIAKGKYWFPELDRADPRTAAVAFDAGYIAGPDIGRRILRQSGGDPERALELYRGYLSDLADRNPAKAKYRAGWDARVDKLARFVGGDGDRAMLRLDAFDGDRDAMSLAQAEVDRANMDAQLSASERAHADAVDYEPADDADLPVVMEGSGVEAPATTVDDRAVADDRASPDPASPAIADAAPIDDAPARIAPETLAAIKAYVEQTRASVSPKKVAAALEIGEDEARNALAVASARQGSGLVVGRDGRVRRAPVRRAPADLNRFLAENGGIRDSEGHDLIAGRGLQRFVPGVGQLIRKGGMTLDRARELAAEAGYFHDRSADAAISDTTTSDFLELLDQAHEGGHYALPDLEAAAERERDQELANELTEIKQIVDNRLTEHGFDLSRDQRRRAADLVQQDGLEHDEAIVRIVNEEIGDALDAMALEEEDGRYADLAEDFERVLSGSDGGIASRDDGYETVGGNSGSGQTSADERGGASEGRDGDDREAAGLAGPPPLHDPSSAAFGDPDGPAANAVADSLEHDVKASLDKGEAIDPALAERQRQEAQLKADSPMRAATDQDSTIGLGLFDQADQYRLDVEGGERPLKDLLDEIDADEAAIRAAKDCL